MDLNDILVFTRVVQSGSFTAAARALDLTKSSISRKVSELEDRLGARLLQRTTRKLSLTDVGRAYYENCARIVAELEEADLAVGRMQSSARGVLRITVPLAFGAFGAIVAEFSKRYPEVQVEIVATDRQVDLVEEGFDLAIRAGALADSTLIARPLGQVRRLLVASPAYLKKSGQPKAPADLEKHACLVFAAAPSPARWTLRRDGKSVKVSTPARLVVNDFELLREAARSGLGIATLPEYLCKEDFARGRLRAVLPAWCTEETPIHAVYPTTRHLSPKVIAFVDVVRARFSLLTRRAGA
ncbi:MAG: Transcriptional regulator, LysR family [Myxococcales bacterium]|nr:Transcriptional regulator, LysR family [Myxococcales bacterium]